MKVLVILGHPDKDSLCGAIVDEYYLGLGNIRKKKLLLGEIDFDPILWHGYKEVQQLEPDLVQAQRDILWADHIVIVFPTWWFSVPAILKGFFDRVLLPGFAYKHDQGLIPQQFLKGKSAHLITPTGGPWWFFRLYGNPALKMVKRGTLNFTGVMPVKTTLFGSAAKIDKKRAKRILMKAYNMGKRQAKK